MWHRILKRTKTYRHEHRRHLLVDGLLVGLVLALGIFILIEKRPSPIPISVPLELRLEGEARYFSATGEQIGTGPNPSVVGERTTYWIFFNARVMGATSHKTTLAVTLGENAEWTGQGSIAGTGWIAAPTDHAIVADLGNLLDGSRVQGTLEVAITLKAGDDVLIEKVKLRGEDDAGQRVIYTLGEIR